MAKRPLTPKQKAALDRGREIRAANLADKAEKERKAQERRERRLELDARGDRSAGRTEPARKRKATGSDTGQKRTRQRSRSARSSERTEEPARTGKGFLGGLVDSWRS
jgi:hypothetical protein